MKMYLRRSANNDTFELDIQDRVSNTTFLNLKMTRAEFIDMIGGLVLEVEGEIYNLERVGKQRESQELVFEVSNDYSDPRELAPKKAQEICPDGWTPSLSFNSQNSFFYKDNKKFARTQIYRWV